MRVKGREYRRNEAGHWCWVDVDVEGIRAEGGMVTPAMNGLLDEIEHWRAVQEALR